LADRKRPSLSLFSAVHGRERLVVFVDEDFNLYGTTARNENRSVSLIDDLNLDRITH